MLEKIFPQTQSLLELERPSYLAEFLCQNAEPIFKDAVEKQGKVVLVNDTFLVKGSGKVVALCLKNVYDSQQQRIFKKGSFYCPIEKAREKILKNFGIPNDDTPGRYQLKTRDPVLQVPGAQWIFLRDSFETDPEKYVDTIITRLQTKVFFPVKNSGYHAHHSLMNSFPYPERRPKTIRETRVPIDKKSEFGIEPDHSLSARVDRLWQSVKTVFNR